MFAFLGSSLFKYVAIFLVAAVLISGIGIYIKTTIDTITQLSGQVAALNAQAKSLQAANTAMAADIANVQSAQATFNVSLNSIRTQAAQASHTIQNRVLNTTNIPALQTQVNQDTATTFRALQDLSNTP